MSGFSPDWLALRNEADLRARNTGLASEVRARFSAQDRIRVIDLGAGTGANLRASAALLPRRQEWLLIDHDPRLIEAARHECRTFADHAAPIADASLPHGLRLEKSGRLIEVRFRKADLAEEIEALLDAPADLVSASALFDLVSEAFISRFAKALAGRKTAVYTVLTYDGQDSFAPAHPEDSRVIEAFARHQRRDKGLGPAAGPEAARKLAQALEGAGFRVRKAPSPWVLRAADHALVSELVRGIAAAATEIAASGETALSGERIEAWLADRLAARHREDAEIRIGHQDLFATP